jgi:hypothetical protein
MRTLTSLKDDPTEDTTTVSAGTWRDAPVAIEIATLRDYAQEVSDYESHEAPVPRRKRGATAQMSDIEQLLTAPRLAWEEAAKLELHLMGLLRHPNLVQFYGIAFSGKDLRFISEPPLVPLSLELYVRHPPWLAYARARQGLIYDVALGVEYLHRKGVVHRCVSIDHVYLRDGPPPQTAKLGGLLPMRVFHRVRRQMQLASQVHEAKEEGVSARNTIVKHQLIVAVGTSVDPRTADVYALGALSLQLLTSEEDEEAPTSPHQGGRRHHHATDSQPLTPMQKTPSLRFDHQASYNSRTGIAHRSAAVGRIRNRTLGLVVLKCMERETQYRMSASMVVRALYLILYSNGVGCLEPIADDLSRLAPLTDAEDVPGALGRDGSPERSTGRPRTLTAPDDVRMSPTKNPKTGRRSAARPVRDDTGMPFV